MIAAIFTKAFQRGEFALARDALARYQQDYQGFDELLCTLYEDRLETVLAAPPATWDGVFTYESK